jgi:hypothetical protein
MEQVSIGDGVKIAAADNIKEKKGNRPRSQSSIVKQPPDMSGDFPASKPLAVQTATVTTTSVSQVSPKLAEPSQLKTPLTTSAPALPLPSGTPPASRVSTSSSISASRSASMQHFKVFPISDASTFAYFRKTDTKPRRQRQLLYAFHVRHTEIKQNYEADEKYVPKAGEAAKPPGVLIKLNSLLKTKKKKKKTRSGIDY